MRGLRRCLGERERARIQKGDADVRVATNAYVGLRGYARVLPVGPYPMPSKPQSKPQPNPPEAQAGLDATRPHPRPGLGRCTSRERRRWLPGGLVADGPAKTATSRLVSNVR